MSEAMLAENPNFWPRLAALSLVLLLPSLGTSIANVALPTLAKSFDATMADVQWVVVSYLLSVTSLIVGAGRLGDIVGRSRLLMAGIMVFATASALCAMAPTMWFLIAARALQGLGAAIMMALSVAMVGDLVPKDRTGSAMGLLGTVSAVGTALGPSLGGALIASFGWPAIFMLLAVLGAIAVLIGRLLFPTDVMGSRRPSGFDFAGLILLASSLLAFSLTMTMSGKLSGPTLVALAAIAGLALLAFVAHEARASEPLVRLDLLRGRKLGTGLTSLALVSAIVMATLIVGPFYMSGTLGFGAVETGLAMSVGPGVAALSGAPAGQLVDRLGAFRVVFSGLLAVVAGSLLLTVLAGYYGIGGYLAGLVLVTFGYAFFQAANTADIMREATSDRRGVTSALLGLSRNLGLIAGASAMGAVYAIGPRIADTLGLGGGGDDGLRVTFAVATGLAALALGVALWGRGSVAVIGGLEAERLMDSPCKD